MERAGHDRRVALEDEAAVLAAEWTAMVSPAITVVAQPTLDLGRRAASLLLRRIAEPASAPTVELLQPRLVVRGSSGPPRD